MHNLPGWAGDGGLFVIGPFTVNDENVTESFDKHRRGGYNAPDFEKEGGAFALYNRLAPQTRLIAVA
jgi:hypothetical protein